MNKPKKIKDMLKTCEVGKVGACSYDEKKHLVDCLYSFNVPEQEQKEILDAFDENLIEWGLNGYIDEGGQTDELTIQFKPIKYITKTPI